MTVAIITTPAGPRPKTDAATRTHGRLTIGDPPPGAPPCAVCGELANLILITHPLCKACLVDLVELGMEMDR